MLRSLVVEDNVAYRQTLCDLLRTRFPDLEIREAQGVDEAWEHVTTHAFDLVFVDIGLPDGSGLDLTSEICRACPEAVVVILTNFDTPEYRQAAVDCGAQHFFSKSSCSVRDVTAIVEDLLAGRGLL